MTSFLLKILNFEFALAQTSLNPALSVRNSTFDNDNHALWLWSSNVVDKVSSPMGRKRNSLITNPPSETPKMVELYLRSRIWWQILYQNLDFLFGFNSNHNCISLSLGDIRVWHIHRRTDGQITRVVTIAVHILAGQLISIVGGRSSFAVDGSIQLSTAVYVQQNCCSNSYRCPLTTSWRPSLWTGSFFAVVAVFRHQRRHRFNTRHKLLGCIECMRCRLLLLLMFLSVNLSVCLSRGFTRLGRAKTGKRSELLFGVRTFGGPRKTVLGRGLDLLRRGESQFSRCQITLASYYLFNGIR